MSFLLFTNFFLSSVMFGVIIITQFVSYPIFPKVEMSNFATYHDDYVRRISFIVVPAMVVELFISAFIYFYFTTLTSLLIFLSLIFIFISTFIIQVPIHNKIKFGGRRFLFNRLVKTNMIRTFFWFLKCIFSFLIIVEEVL